MSLNPGLKDLNPDTLLRDLIPAFRTITEMHADNGAPETKELMFALDLLEDAVTHAQVDVVEYALYVLPDQLQFSIWTHIPEAIGSLAAMINSVGAYLRSPNDTTQRDIGEKMSQLEQIFKMP